MKTRYEAMSANRRPAKNRADFEIIRMQMTSVEAVKVSDFHKRVSICSDGCLDDRIRQVTAKGGMVG